MEHGLGSKNKILAAGKLANRSKASDRVIDALNEKAARKPGVVIGGVARGVAEGVSMGARWKKPVTAAMGGLPQNTVTELTPIREKFERNREVREAQNMWLIGAGIGAVLILAFMLVRRGG